ncbi:MAG TPA: hypothetical protein PKE45_15170, partial [Caldilineaceae bacterium]|nr:hypothetical protein [Caldilineaceae bacterium]
MAGLPSDSVLTLGDQNFLFTKGWGWGSGWRYLIRLSTSLADDLGQVLFNEGLEALLALETQSIHEEALSGFSLINNNPAKLVFAWESPLHPNFDGAYGEYYWEIFFHIPFLIANHLNANQKFKEAKWWYERIFDPTSSELPDSANPTERNWRYVEFREVTLPKMKEILTHDAAIEQYKRDPFNPH